MVSTHVEEPMDGIEIDDITYHQIGLLVNPMASDTYPNFANNSIYDLTTQITLSGGVGGTFTSGEQVIQIDNTVGSATQGKQLFTGIVLDFNTSTNVLKVINTVGTPTLSQSLAGTSGTVRTLMNYTNPDLMINSGFIVFLENRSGVQRSTDSIEQFKIVLGY